MKLTLSLSILLIISSCAEKENKNDTPPPLYPEPAVVKLNIDSGYLINPTSGDSILPSINSNGDTIAIGVPIPAVGKVVYPDSIIMPNANSKFGKNDQLQQNQVFDVHQIHHKLKTADVDVSKLEIISIKEIIDYDSNKDSDTSSEKRTITGKRVEIIGEKTKVIQPEPKVALAAKAKEGAFFDVKYYSTDEGLVFKDILSILHDSKDNIWFGSKGGGVSRFDGKLFSNYTIQEGLPSNIVWTIFEDSQGNIWFGTFGGGVCRYDGESFETFDSKTGFPSDVVFSVIEDNNKNIWIGSYGAGISRFDGEKFVHFNTENGLVGDQVDFIFKDGKGDLWISSRGDGVSKYDGKSFTNFREKDGLLSNYVNCIFEDEKQNLWFGTQDKGACYYDGKSFHYLTKSEGLSDNTVKAIYQDETGLIWFGFWDGKICTYDGEQIVQLSDEDGFIETGVHAISQDNSGGIWFGTSLKGVLRYDRNSFRNITARNETLIKSCRVLAEDSIGNIWLGTSEGLNIFDGKKLFYLTEKNGLPNDDIRSLAIDKDHNLWIGSFSGGLSKYDGDRFVNYSVKEGLPSIFAFDVMNDKNGNIWIGSQGGLSKYNGEYFTNFDEKEGLASNFAISLVEDSKGNLWFSSYTTGVTRFDGKTLTHYSEKTGLPRNFIKSIYEDKEGNMWFGSTNGIICFDGENYIHYTSKQGLSDGTVQSIIEDNRGNIWCSTFGGINKLSPVLSANKNEKPIKFTITSFDKSDGLTDLVFMLNSVLMSKSGTMYWGTTEGISMIDLNNFYQAQKSPKINLRNIKVNETFIDYHNFNDTTNSNIRFKKAALFENYPHELELPYNKNHLTFIFSGTEWSAPNKVKYSYLIEGLDSKWSLPSLEGEADYRNLPSGKFKFKVCSIGESGKWSEPFVYEFTILPPWWLTWWAKTAYLAILVLTVIGYVSFRTKKLKQRQKELEEEIAIATQEIRKERDISENLLLNILPEEVAKELKQKGHSDAQLFDSITVLFTDFKGFTNIAEKLSAKNLVEDLNVFFTAFDEITTKYGVEKIKTIGDAYMAAGGLPIPKPEHARKVVLAALEMAKFIEEGKARRIEQGLPFFEIRIGIHTGPVVAGIVGVKKFQYDIWGDTVNIASRMESSGEVGQVNISEATYELVKDYSEFRFTSRGNIEAKGKGAIKMWFVERVNFED